MPDQDFERAFATLAHAELSQKAPGLMPYLIGFQVVQKNDDGSRAAGVFGFKVGEQWYYGPVFWMNGKIRGYDLLYIVGQDLFVPLQESWVNYVTNRRPYVMGEGIMDKNLTQMGVMQPDFTIFRRSPLTKGACEKAFKGGVFDPWCKPAAMYLLPTDQKYAGLDQRTSLPVVLTKFSAVHTEAVLKAMRDNEKFAEAVYRFYSPADIAVAAKSMGRSAIFKSAAPNTDRMISSKGGKDTKIEVLYGTNNIDPKTTTQLTAKEREQLMKGDAVVDDKREAKDKAEVYKTPEFEKVFQTPSISGVWKVMPRTGALIDALVSIHVTPIGKGAVPPNATVVIDLDSKKYSFCYKQDVLAKTQSDPMNWKKQFETFRTAQNIGAGDIGVLVNKDFVCTQPFKVLKATTDKDGSKVLCVRVDDSILGPKNSFGEVKDDLKPPTQPSMAGSSIRHDRVKNDSDADIGKPGSSCWGVGSNINYNYSTGNFYCDAGTAAREAPYESEAHKKRCCGHHIKLTKKPVSISNVQDTLILNQDDMRFIPLKVEGKVAQKDWGSWSNLDLAGHADMDIQIRKMGMQKVSVHYDGDSEFHIFGTRIREKHAAFGRALKVLMSEFGMGETDARTILKEARLKTKTSALVKQAAVSPMLSMDPISSYDSTYRANTQVPMSDQSMIPSNAPYPNMQESMQPIVDPHAQSMAMSAANNGQKEVFDLSLLSSLIRAGGDTDGKIQDFLKDVILGNDRIGRILFLYYWHNDKFTERYGDKDLIELEDLLRETFKGVGDLVLFLKQKSIEPESVAAESVVTL